MGTRLVGGYDPVFSYWISSCRVECCSGFWTVCKQTMCTRLSCSLLTQEPGIKANIYAVMYIIVLVDTSKKISITFFCIGVFCMRLVSKQWLSVFITSSSEHSWWLASSQGHSQILSCSCGEPSFLHGCEIKSGSGLHGDEASWWLWPSLFVLDFVLQGWVLQWILNCVQANHVYQALLFSVNTRTWDQG